MNKCLLNWMDNNTKIVVKFKYGDYVYDDSGYIKNFDEIGVTMLLSPEDTLRAFPWTSVIYICEA